MINCPFKEYKKTTYVASAIGAVSIGYFALKYYRCKAAKQAKQAAEASEQDEVKQDEVKQD